MKKVCSVLLILLTLISLFVSCNRADLSVYQTLVQPYIKSNGEMGLSLFLRTSVKEGERTNLYITDPSGKLSWTVDGVEAVFDDVNYIGNADIAMPEGSVLPVGTWNVDIIYKDGRKISQSFEVGYKNSDTVLSGYPEVTKPVYDADSNLTILP